MKEYPLALVTGAAHRLGRTFALTLAKQGYGILLHYHQSAEAASSTAEEIRALHVPAYPLKADLTDSAQIQLLFSTIDSMDGKLEVVINSAARMRRMNLRNLSIDEWDSSLNLNLRAPLLLGQFAAQRMTDGGLIVNVTDAGVGKPWSGFPAYLISKAGLEVLTRLMAKTYAPNIRVNAIAPGLVLPSADTSNEEWNRLVDRLPLKQPVTLEQISQVLEFLLNNDSITGQTIVVDGGYSLI
jgi:pteridine reductase